MHVGDILSAVRDVQYRGGYHEYHGGYLEYRGESPGLNRVNVVLLINF